LRHNLHVARWRLRSGGTFSRWMAQRQRIRSFVARPRSGVDGSVARHAVRSFGLPARLLGSYLCPRRSPGGRAGAVIASLYLSSPYWRLRSVGRRSRWMAQTLLPRRSCGTDRLRPVSTRHTACTPRERGGFRLRSAQLPGNQSRGAPAPRADRLRPVSTRHTACTPRERGGFRLRSAQLPGNQSRGAPAPRTHYDLWSRPGFAGSPLRPGQGPPGLRPGTFLAAWRSDEIRRSRGTPRTRRRRSS
jgi:hypothetical protein